MDSGEPHLSWSCKFQRRIKLLLQLLQFFVSKRFEFFPRQVPKWAYHQQKLLKQTRNQQAKPLTSPYICLRCRASILSFNFPHSCLQFICTQHQAQSNMVHHFSSSFKRKFVFLHQPVNHLRHRICCYWYASFHKRMETITFDNAFHATRNQKLLTRSIQIESFRDDSKPN